MQWVLSLIVGMLCASAFAQVSVEEAAAKLKEREVARVEAAKRPENIVQAEVDRLRKQVAELLSELKSLKEENGTLRDQISQRSDADKKYAQLKAAQVAAAAKELSDDASIKNDPPIKSIKLLGDESSIAAIIADPASFLKKEIVLCGTGSIQNYYTHNFSNFTESHYSLRFIQRNEKTVDVGDCHIFAERVKFRALVNRMAKLQSNKGATMLFRAKVKMTATCFDDDGRWIEAFELVDWQPLKPDQSAWGPWMIRPE